MRLLPAVALFFALGAQAVPLKKIELTPEQERAIQQHHQMLNMVAPSSTQAPPARPVSELEDAGYLFFSADTHYNSALAKKTMARHLPPGVTLVIYTQPGRDKARILDEYRTSIDPRRIKVVEISNSGRGFWARDGLPVPVWSSEGSMQLVDARYYHNFEPDDLIGSWFHSPLRKHTYFFEGGNFMVNDQGVCVTVDNSRSSSIPDLIFTAQYGCKTLIRLPFEKGIGHVDESVRFLTSQIVLTDSANYAARLRQAGLDVRMLPRPQRAYETYVNALLVNGTVFVPVYNGPKDQEALDVYRATGLKVVPIETITLSNNGLGSIHCITMTYPRVPFQQLLGLMGGRELN